MMMVLFCSVSFHISPAFVNLSCISFKNLLFLFSLLSYFVSYSPLPPAFSSSFFLFLLFLLSLLFLLFLLFPLFLLFLLSSFFLLFLLFLLLFLSLPLPILNKFLAPWKSGLAFLMGDTNKTEDTAQNTPYLISS